MNDRTKLLFKGNSAEENGGVGARERRCVERKGGDRRSETATTSQNKLKLKKSGGRLSHTREGARRQRKIEKTEKKNNCGL